MLTDSHCHLDQLDDPPTILAEAAAAGVGRIVAVAEGPASIPRVLELAGRHPGSVLAGVGVHPVPYLDMSADEIEAYLAELPELLQRAAVLGEVGLDFLHAADEETRGRQRAFLEAQFEAAARAGRPVNLHSRRAERQTLEAAIAFRRRTGLGAQMHWFTRSRKLARIAGAEGIHVSVGPSLVDSEATAAVVAEIADDLLLLETDAPVPIGGLPNHPRRVAEVAAAVAAVKGWDLDETARRTEENLERFLAGATGPG